MRGAIELAGIDLVSADPPDGRSAFASLLDWAASGLARLEGTVDRHGGTPRMVVGRVRGRGPGVSFGEVLRAVELWAPRPLLTPFEGTDRVAGAAWDGRDLLGPSESGGMLKLRFAPGADDLPMHSHESSDRFIVVLEGRGFFHASDEPLDRFSGVGIETIAVRERDVLMFRRGTMHTFSTTDHPLTLLSIHRPFIALDDPDQFTLPARICLPGREPPPSGRLIGCDWGWTVVV